MKGCLRAVLLLNVAGGEGGRLEAGDVQMNLANDMELPRYLGRWVEVMVFRSSGPVRTPINPMMAVLTRILHFSDLWMCYLVGDGS